MHVRLEVLTMTDEFNHIDKDELKVPFVYGCCSLGKTLQARTGCQVAKVSEAGNFSIVNFAGGGVATPTNDAIMMQLGIAKVFIRSGFFNMEKSAACAAAIIRATMH
eukprot:8517266-Ditylum_brightwellii.AAC.1